ncbi:MAG: TetR/AcrR family transcriptional regulator [Alphaproteobacteria bacterium]|nr:TetR/AcrR family transcriptional regulator [Alphaproteobacteria bacterium]
MTARGRPPGRTEKGEASRAALYATAVKRFTEDGYEATTLRGIAREAGVSPALLYKYFPSKQAVVMALYDDLSARFADGLALPEAGWTVRVVTTLRFSLEVLAPTGPRWRRSCPSCSRTGSTGCSRGVPSPPATACGPATSRRWQARPIRRPMPPCSDGSRTSCSSACCSGGCSTGVPISARRRACWGCWRAWVRRWVRCSGSRVWAGLSNDSTPSWPTPSTTTRRPAGRDPRDRFRRCPFRVIAESRWRGASNTEPR